MTTIQRSADCGNSPKNAKTETIAVALESRDAAGLLAVLDADAVWNNADKRLTGAQPIADRIGALTMPTRLTIDRVMSHGKVGAVNGTAAQGSQQRRFCHVIEFTSVKCDRVARIESY